MLSLFVCNGLIVFPLINIFKIFFFIMISNTFQSLKETCAYFLKS